MEHERWCTKNGFSIHSGREVMISSLLSLEELEKHKNQGQDEEVRYGYDFAIGGKHGRETNYYLKLGGGRWTTGKEQKSILDNDKEYMSTSRQNF